MTEPLPDVDMVSTQHQACEHDFVCLECGASLDSLQQPIGWMTEGGEAFIEHRLKLERPEDFVRFTIPVPQAPTAANELSAEQEERVDALRDECSRLHMDADRSILRQIVHLQDEIQRLRTALTGISTCSTREACRGAATRALGEPTKEQAFRAALGPAMYDEIYSRKPDPGPMGTCCYGGRKLRGDCASCAAWRADPPPGDGP